MKLRLGYFLTVFLLCAIAHGNAFAKQPEKRVIIGYVENVRVKDVDSVIKAKLDTGAATSSIHVDIIEEDEDYVVFEIEAEATKDNTKKLKKKIARHVRIKKKGGDDHIRRPVVKMTFCIAGQLVEEEVNLADRDGFNYDLLIGRNMLEKALLIVDVSKTFTGRPNCPAEE